MAAKSHTCIGNCSLEAGRKCVLSRTCGHEVSYYMQVK